MKNNLKIFSFTSLLLVIFTTGLLYSFYDLSSDNLSSVEILNIIESENSECLFSKNTISNNLKKEFPNSEIVYINKEISIFPDSKRLQDRSLPGLYAIFPYLAAIPLQFHFVPEFLLKIYIICTWILKAYIFVNTGILKGEDKPNKYGEIDDFKGDYKEKVSVVENDRNKD